MQYGDFKRRVEVLVQEAADTWGIEASLEDDTAFIAFKVSVASDVAWLAFTELEGMEKDD